MKNELWPALPLAEWKDTYATLHMWTQIVGKIKLGLTPLINHWWNVPLYVSAHGLTTSVIPCGERDFEMEFDFLDHNLHLRSSDGAEKHVALYPRSVADFYHEVMQSLRDLSLELQIWTTPVEVPNPIPFEQDHTHASYDAEYANRFWHVLAQTDRVFTEFRARFIGKCSPVHFFWGSFDLAVTRFSGRRAPARPGADVITREAYSHEVISHGFWPGNDALPTPAFYSYTAPAPAGLEHAAIYPPSAFYSQELTEFILRYDDVRQANSPDKTLLEFLQSTYEAGAQLAHWDRTELERVMAA